MKKYLAFLMSLLLVLSFASCEQIPEDPKEDDKTEQGGTEGENEGDNGGENEGEGNQGQQGTYEDPTNSRVPIEWSELLAEGSDVGVTIEVTDLSTQNFVFELRPGAMVQSFKMDVFPLAHLYNYLLNDDMYDKETWEIHEQIRSYMNNTEGSGAYLFSVEDFDNPDDFLQIEFDWMNTSYAPASAIAIPDCSYIIAVIACTDTAGAAQEDLTLCHVHTTSQTLLGDPRCEIEVNAGYRQFVVNHVLNSDAAGVYYFGGLAADIDEYVDMFGDTMLRDFVRTYISAPVAADNEDALHYRYDYGQYADDSIESATIAVCCDANLTPQKGYSRRDFHLEEIPDEQEAGEVTVEIVEDRVAAAYFEFDAVFEANCNTIFYRFYSPEQKAALEAASEVDQQKEAQDLVYNGYGQHNPGFTWDKENGAPTGTGSTVRMPQWGMEFAPGETFYVGYTGRNGFGTPSGLQFSEPVTLDERNLTSPDECKVKDLTLTLSNATRNLYYYDIQYDPSTVSMVYCQYFTADNNPGLDENSSWQEWAEFIFTPSSSGTGSAMYSNINVNTWPSLPSGRDRGAYTGMTPNTEYTVFVCAEDFDGNISPMCFQKISTLEVQVGPNPRVEMELIADEGVDFLGNQIDWTVNILLKEDVEYIRYRQISIADGYDELSSEMPDLTRSKFRDIANSGIPYEEWVDALYTITLGNDGEGGGLKTDGDADVSWAGDDVMIVTCVAVGQNDDGTPAYNFFHLVCEDGNATTLEEIFSVENE